MSLSHKQAHPPLVWERDVPLLTNPAILRSVLLMWLVSAGVMIALVGGIIAARDGFKAIVPIVEMCLMIVGGLTLLSFVIMVVMFGNRLRMAFAIDERGVVARVVDRRAKATNRLASLMGVLGGRPGVAGAGMIAMSDEERSAVWSSIVEARYDARHFTITLRNGWRPVLHLFCSPENFQDAADRVAASLAAARRPARRARNPLWSALGLTLLVVLSISPLFGMPYPFKPELFSVIFTLCFALAMVWLIPLMGWPVLGGVSWIAGTIVLQGLEVHTNQFSGSRYSGFGSLYGAEWIGFAATCLGLAVLAGIAVGALRGRIPSLLMNDMLEMAGEDVPGKPDAPTGGKTGE